MRNAPRTRGEGCFSPLRKGEGTPEVNYIWPLKGESDYQ